MSYWRCVQLATRLWVRIQVQPIFLHANGAKVGLKLRLILGDESETLIMAG